MSLCLYGRINQKELSEMMVERMLTDYFSIQSKLVKEKDLNGVTYEVSNAEDDLLVSFIDIKKSPYNLYDSVIIGGEYEYSQLIIFDMKKEKATIEKYKYIIGFFTYLKSCIDCDILVTSDAHDEICLLHGQDIFWSERFCRVEN